jgi:hypothetical protein
MEVFPIELAEGMLRVISRISVVITVIRLVRPKLVMANKLKS